MTKFLWCHAKGPLIATLIFSVFMGISLPLRTFLIEKIIDSASITHSYHSVGRSLIIYTCVFLVLLIFSVGIQKIQTWLNIIIQNRLEMGWGNELFSRCAKIKYSYFERQDTYIVIDRLVSSFKIKISTSISILPDIINLSVSLVGILVYILQSGIETIVILVITSVPIWIISIKSSLKERDAYRQLHPHFMKAQYFSGLITLRENIKEARVFKYHSYISKKWKESLSKYQHGVFLANLKERNITGLLVILQYIVVNGVIFYLLRPLNSRAISIGFLVAVAQVLWSYVGDLQFKIISIIQNINTCRSFLIDYSQVMSYDIDKTDLEPTLKNGFSDFESLEFKDVWFRYGEMDHYILRGVNFIIRKGNTISLVGANGSGKTTIIKLLLGLLIPTKGSVLINGIDSQQIDGESRKKIMSSILQDFSRYSLTLKESIILKMDVDNSKNDEIMSLLSSLSQSENIMKNMSDGLNTVLGKNIDNGIDLSGGQWQTIAIARALYAKSPLLIMDEPTASLDPIAESEVYKQLVRAMSGKTVVFVTHRLGSTKLADVILTLENGCIAEQGSHEQLINMEGAYAKMYATQRQWYK